MYHTCHAGKLHARTDAPAPIQRRPTHWRLGEAGRRMGECTRKPHAALICTARAAASPAMRTTVGPHEASDLHPKSNKKTTYPFLNCMGVLAAVEHHRALLGSLVSCVFVEVEHRHTTAPRAPVPPGAGIGSLEEEGTGVWLSNGWPELATEERGPLVTQRAPWIQGRGDGGCTMCPFGSGRRRGGGGAALRRQDGSRHGSGASQDGARP